MTAGYETIASVVLFIGFSGVAGIGGWIWHLSHRLTVLESDTMAATDRAKQSHVLALNALAQIADFKLEAARSFVQAAALERLEGRLEAGFSAMRDELRDQQRTIVEALAARRPSQSRSREG